MKSVVVVGCPFSGTKYMAEVLRYCGINVGHEKMQEDGIVSWQHTHWGREDFIKHGVKEPMVILHLVKHPIMAISSFSLLPYGAWRWLGDWAEKKCPDWNPREQDILLRSMFFWVVWNNMAARLSNYGAPVVIEKLPFQWREFLQVVGVRKDLAYPAIDTRLNRHGSRQIITWEQMVKVCKPVALEIRDMAERYGYPQYPVNYFNDSFYDFSMYIGGVKNG